MGQDQEVKKVTELMDDVRICMFTTINDSGVLKSRPMTLQEMEFDGDLWFVTDRSSDKVQEITSDPQVNVSFGNDSTWVSLSGSAELIEDEEKAEELWSDAYKVWFDGPDDPDLILVKVQADGAEYWDSGSKIATLIKMADTAVRGKRHDMGENETIDL